MRALLDKLSRTQLRILATAALLAPGALGAAVVFQPVAIVDPNSGLTSVVDLARRLYVHDPVAGYANNPINFVNISRSTVSNNEPVAIYAPPAGKALVIKSIQFSYYYNNADNTVFMFLADQLGTTLMNFEGQQNSETINNVYEPGIILKNNQILTVRFGSDNSAPRYGFLTIQGHLIPAGAVPAAASLEATQQFVNAGQAIRQSVRP